MLRMTFAAPVAVRSLLAWRGGLLDDVAASRNLGGHIVALSAVMIAGAAGYGVVLGKWHGARLALYCAIKLPLVLILTTLITIAFSWVAALLLGVPLRFAQVAVLNLLTLATASLLLASLIPVAWLFTQAAPPPTTASRTAHNLLYLMHTGIVALCGAGGMRLLWTALGRVAPRRARLLPVYVLWFTTFALVGGEVAWALRPFVGSVSADYPVVFLRKDALDGNVYEFIVTDILPHLARSLED
jgi:hypothetical protein